MKFRSSTVARVVELPALAGGLGESSAYGFLRKGSPPQYLEELSRSSDLPVSRRPVVLLALAQTEIRLNHLGRAEVVLDQLQSEQSTWICRWQWKKGPKERRFGSFPL